MAWPEWWPDWPLWWPDWPASWPQLPSWIANLEQPPWWPEASGAFGPLPVDPSWFWTSVWFQGATWYDLVVAVLIIWAITGLTLIHLGVLAFQFTRDGVRHVARAAMRPFRPGDPGGRSGRAARPPPPDLSLGFVVAVYNDALTIGQCIESILRQSHAADEIVVVNDGSTDGTAETIEKYRSRGVHVVHMSENRGKTRAIEEGLKHLKTDLVSITDADSLVDQDYVREIKESFRDPEVTAAGGAVESIPHTWITAARQIEYMMTVRINRAAENHMDSIVVLPGVSSTYRRSVFDEFGFEYDTIAEDFDLTFRLHKAGRKIVMNLRARVYTSDPPTVKSYYKQVLRWYTDFWICVKKHYELFGKRLFGTVNLPMTLLNTATVSVLFLTLPVYFLLFDPVRLLHFLAVGTLLDGLLIGIAHVAYKRRDVYWAFVSRYPTRIAGRLAFVVAMTRVLVGRPGMEWTKLERRSTQDALEAMGTPPASSTKKPAEPAGTESS